VTFPEGFHVSVASGEVLLKTWSGCASVVWAKDARELGIA